jgi:hypothetical protein
VGLFYVDEGTDKFELVAGVGTSGGQPGSDAMAWRSLTTDKSRGTFEYPLWARRDATHDGGGSQPEERHGLAAEVHGIIRRQKTPVRGVFE